MVACASQRVHSDGAGLCDERPYRDISQEYHATS